MERNFAKSIFPFIIEFPATGRGRSALSSQKRRAPIVGRYTREELALASRNSGMPLEALRYDGTPAGLHYLLIHIDIPEAVGGWGLAIDGLGQRPHTPSMDAIPAPPPTTPRATLECASNGRGPPSPRH